MLQCLEKLNSRLNRTLCFLVNKQIFVNKYSTMKYLNVAEKNDAAKNIASHLSKGTSTGRKGLSKYNKIYQFKANVMGQDCEMVMTSVSGHLLALEFSGTYRTWQTCSPLSLFDAPVFKYCPENYQKIKMTLEREVRSCQGLIIWTDCDREGENIGFEIIDVCKAARTNLKIYRAKFSEITLVSVNRALQNLEEPNKNTSNAVDVRQELDLRIGAAFTRFQTLRLQKVFPSKLTDTIVSYGSCQFPTLGFVVERYRAIENFIVETFWKLKVNHTIENLSVEFAWERFRLFDEYACKIFHDICTENPLARVLEVKTKPKSKWRPLPLETVELEKQASRKLKIHAKETMQLAEKLYTQGFISYPRTETNEFPKEMNLAQLVGQQTGDPNWGTFAQKILDNGGPTPRQGKKSDKAHPPIHPTKYTNNLSGNEKRLYEFIVRSFLACCSKDAQGQETIVNIDIGREKFSANGLVITELNYLEVYIYEKWSSKEIHVYQEGQIFSPTSIDIVSGTTSPPSLLTEADLISLMEKHGIGTDATHAEHIEKIKSRSYVALADEKYFVPGVLGMGLVEGYDAMGLEMSKPHLRAQLESDLKEIIEGRKQPEAVLSEQIAKYKEVYIKASAEAEKIDRALAERLNEQPAAPPASGDTLPVDMPAALKCPKCGSDMIVRQKKNNPTEYYIGCMSFPNCKNVVWLPNIVKSLQVLPDTCTECGPDYKMMKFEWRNNSISHIYAPPYTGCIGGCDRTFLEYLNININSVIKTSGSSAQVTSSNTSSRTDISVPIQNHIIPSNALRNPIEIGSNRGRDIPAQRNNAMNTTNIRMNSASNAANLDDNHVVCRCSKPAILLTSKKQNQNFGQKFYKCPVGKENGGCDFFLWAPESVNNAQSAFETPPSSSEQTTFNTTGVARRDANRNRNTGSGNTDDVKCDCRLPCKKLTVHKEGPNKGRQFYGCAKDLSSKCNFFKWADESGSRPGPARPAPVSSRGGGRASRRGAVRHCSFCGSTEHDFRTCSIRRPSTD
ncbi:DNA topoisomerase 3-alpha isoform X1 [Bombyx mori]|uniref:DNA topoisomerase n=2 Tax=Bombyx mori TaxID=7091 RepID=A0A8R2GBT4_BOMMO|nr:DNA topoisomerase 3-alpha isoform X1 [Bombyx mori]